MKNDSQNDSTKDGNNETAADLISKLESELAEVKREVARMCFVKYKGVWIFCHPTQYAMERLGITAALLEDMAEEKDS